LLALAHDLAGVVDDGRSGELRRRHAGQLGGCA